jgi:hypothetical protein
MSEVERRTSTMIKRIERCQGRMTTNNVIHFLHKSSFRYINVLKVGRHMSNFEMIVRIFYGA